MRFTTKLIPSRTHNMGILLLNNPKALHALTRDMVDCMDDVLREWKNDPTLRAILIKSSSEETKRAVFCAGGDVKSVYMQCLDHHKQQTKGREKSPPEDFFRHEYKVNHGLATCIDTIPIVSLWDGLVMGGGVGISIHGKYRVATEKTIFSMPECRIGFFPDVGSMWWMTRILKRRAVANYLALTGQQMTPADLTYTGVATHYIPSDRLEDLEYALAEATKSKNEGDVVASILMSFHELIPTDQCNLAINKQIIESTFNGETLDEIFTNLKRANTEFTRSTLEILEKMSPTSMKVTMEGLKRGTGCNTIEEGLQMEYRMARACIRPGMDFHEGIRSLLVDKDHSPNWNPTTIEEVTDDMVQEFFAPIDNEWTHIQTEPAKL
uniref:3-hydroxyisobutyryl-CoA hydrolase n=1 Tax=Pseudo-nitzschia australis TaxID=44445 RepID=A0A7S4AEG2_9STRA|mmetsp:Transcript_2348/g.5049  ORF Transcript_2348/g.5049 Transcript_2348/m.5049 type:complete len:381 (-) Transcript_2348:1951-3093(-)